MLADQIVGRARHDDAGLEDPQLELAQVPCAARLTKAMSAVTLPLLAVP